MQHITLPGNMIPLRPDCWFDPPIGTRVYYYDAEGVSYGQVCSFELAPNVCSCNSACPNNNLLTQHQGTKIYCIRLEGSGSKVFLP